MTSNPKLWIYNYNLELELAKQAVVERGTPRFAPWFFLNRTTNLFLPFTVFGDAICCYEKPDEHLLDHLEEKTGKRSHYLALDKLEKESNAVVRDIQSSPLFQEKIKPYQLEFWGGAPSALKLRSEMGVQENRVLPDLFSKVVNGELRKKHLPEFYHIPALIYRHPFHQREDFIHDLSDFFDQQGSFIVKSAFGTSGKLSDTVNFKPFSRRSIGRWLSWIRHSGGIMVEKKVPIGREVSLQFEIEKTGVTYLTQTTLETQRDGSYQGTWIDPSSRLEDAHKKNLTQWAGHYQKMGYRGPLGIDLLETPEGEIKQLETNARYTMGRVAYEWKQLFPNRAVGYYRTFFFNKKRTESLEDYLCGVKQIEQQEGADVVVINYKSCEFYQRSMMTLFIAADKVDCIKKVLKKMNREV